MSLRKFVLQTQLWRCIFTNDGIESIQFSHFPLNQILYVFFTHVIRVNQGQTGLGKCFGILIYISDFTNWINGKFNFVGWILLGNVADILFWIPFKLNNIMREINLRIISNFLFQFWCIFFLNDNVFGSQYFFHKFLLD